jgi:hypothetical protein
MIPVLSGLVVIAALAVGVQLLRMYEESGEWRLTHSATPNRIEVAGRDYDRSNLPPTTLPGGASTKGRTDGGGTIYLPRVEGRTSLLAYVRDEDGIVWSYALVGGP